MIYGINNSDFMVHAVIAAGSQLHTDRRAANDKCKPEDNTGDTEWPCTVDADIEQFQYECMLGNKEYNRRVERSAAGPDT